MQLRRTTLALAIAAVSISAPTALAASSTLSVVPLLSQGYIGTREGWFPSFEIRWTKGVASTAPTAHKKPVWVLRLSETQFKDKRGKHELGLDGGYGRSGTQDVDFYLSGKATGDSVTLRTDPPSGQRVTITGGPEPSLRVVGLPTATALVAPTLEGSAGRRLLHLSHQCTGGERASPIVSTTTSTLAGGSKQRKVAAATTSCKA